MRKLFLTAAILFITNIILAQNTCYIKFTYDANGNRIRRHFECGNSPRLPKPKQASEDYFDFVLFPNPTDGKITINVNNFTSPINVDVYNSVGQKIITSTIIKAQSTIDLSSFGNGIYLISLNNGKIKITKKIEKIN